MLRALAPCLVLTLFAATTCHESAGAATRSENVLIILADDLGVDFVGGYGEGSDPAPTPTIDGLLANGVFFRNAWANPSCSPTRACIQTGQYPFRTTVGRWIDYPHNTNTIGTLRATEVTIPEVLDRDDGGYAHGFIGKWHMSYQSQGLDVPNDAGWSHYSGALDGQVPSYTDWQHVVNGAVSTSNNYITTQQVDDTISWVTAQSGPWLCTLSFVAPHLPMHVPPAHLHSQNLSGVPITNSSRPHYKALIEAMDTEMARLFQTLGPSVMANTNVIFLGDNGSVQNMAAPPFLGGKAKGSPYEGGLNVPLIISGPAVVNPGREVADLASAVDVFDTALDLAGATDAIPVWLETDGVSLVPYVTDSAVGPARTYAYSEQFNGTAWPAPLSSGHATIRNDRFKLIQRMTQADELYDLQTDPWEQSNLLTGALSSLQQQNFDDLVAQIAALRAQEATAVPYGSSSCVGSNGKIPTIQALGTPKLGALYGVSVQDGVPNGSALHLLGFDALAYGGAPLPLDLGSPAGACTLLTAPQLITPIPTFFQGDAYIVGTVPVVQSLVGARIFHQWAMLDPAASNGLGFVTTAAIAGQLGS